MLVKENITINGKEYVYTYSDKDVMIERDGMLFESAIDPAELGREYIETDILIPDDTEAETEDYTDALERFGVQ